MTMKLTKMTLVAAAFAGAGFASQAANAASLNDLIGKQVGTQVFGSDENREILINRVGSANIIDVGDSLRGVFVIEQLFVTKPGGTPQETTLTQSLGNDEFTGVFQIKVASKTSLGVNPATGQEVFAYTYAPDDMFDTKGMGTMIKAWADGGESTFVNNLDASQATAFDVVSDGDFYFGLGIVNGSNGWVGTGGDDISDVGNPSDRLGQSIFALNRTNEVGADGEMLGSALNLGLKSNAAGTGEVVGTSQIGGPLAGSDFPLSSNTNFEFTLVPTPAAIWPGLALLGFVATRRRRQA